MQFEKFDDKVKRAAEQHHPNYDEQAWTKMENLLDKHLPQKNDRRRRIIFFLLFALLIGVSAWIIIGKPWQQEKTVSAFENNNRDKTDHSSSGAAKKTDEAAVPGDLQKKQVTAPQQELITKTTGDNPVIINNKQTNPSLGGGSKPIKDQKLFNSKKSVQDNSFEATIEQGNTARVSKPGNLLNPDETQKTDNSSSVKNNNPVNTMVSPLTENEKTQTVNKNKKQDDVAADNKINDPSKLPVKDAVDQKSPTTVEKNITKKSPGKKGNSFFVSVSAGPDVSSVGTYKPGKVTVIGGAGFGYTFNSRWTIRTGFYTARKIYSADQESYKPDVVIPANPYLDQINADCKVYEIPLSLAYNFAGSQKGNWFTSAGLSSYIMKKEVYDYVYKYPGSTQPQVYTKTVDNENKHYFSVLSLSGGYQRKISKTLSITAEPYIRIPLTGIGFGNVKLNSAGVLFSLSLSLFQPVSVK